MLPEYSSLYLIYGNYNGAPQEVLSARNMFILLKPVLLKRNYKIIMRLKYIALLLIRGRLRQA